MSVKPLRGLPEELWVGCIFSSVGGAWCVLARCVCKDWHRLLPLEPAMKKAALVFAAQGDLHCLEWLMDRHPELSVSVAGNPPLPESSQGRPLGHSAMAEGPRFPLELRSQPTGQRAKADSRCSDG